MLRELSVQNLAVIEDVLVELQPGFCVWTGETGAGKSLLLAALGLLMGRRASADMIRSGADEVRVTGRFELNQSIQNIVAESFDLPPSDEWIISRRVTNAGRSFVYINEQPMSLTTLQRLAPLLVDIHGQRESQSLLSSAYQLKLLDAFGQLDDLREDYRKKVKHVRKLRRELRDLNEQRQFRLRELSLIRFEREELTNADLTKEEVTALVQEREQLRNAQELRAFAARGCAILHDDDGAIVEQLGKLSREAESWMQLDDELKEIATRLAGLAAEAQDVASFLRDRDEKWQSDPGRLEIVDNRIQELRRLETKYGRPVEELIEYLSTLDEKEQSLSGEEASLTRLETDLRSEFDGLIDVGDQLSKKRRKAADRFAKNTMRELSDLGMPEATLEVQLDDKSIRNEQPVECDPPADGFDEMEILLSANPGEPSRPLRKIASGGELSRTMLALKTVLAGREAAGTLVFDEIDANVGGRLGDVLGAKLAKLAESHQVICVTHLPQVASFAGDQWTIRKKRRGKRTFTTIEPLTEAERVEELTAMLRGSSQEESTRREAEAMLKSAKKTRRTKK